MSVIRIPRRGIVFGAGFGLIRLPPIHGVQVISAFVDNFAHGIYYPSDVYISSSANAFVAICSGFARFTSNLPQRWFLSGPDAGAFYLSGTNGSVLYAQAGPAYTNTSRTSFSLIVNVTDGLTTLSHSVTVHNGPVAAYAGANYILNTNVPFNNGTTRSTTAGAQETATAWGARGLSISDPSGNIDLAPFRSAFITTKKTEPAASHYGVYSVQLLAGGTPFTYPVWLINEQPPSVELSLPGTVYTYLQPGEVIGTLLATSDAGVPGGGAAYSMVSSDGTVALSSTGLVVVKTALTEGTNSFTVAVKSNSGLVSNKVITFPVTQGTLLPARNMTMAVKSTLDNYVFGQAVGVASVSTMSGPIVWSVSHPDDCVGIYNGGASLNLFTINPASGAVSGTAGQQLPATAPNVIPGTSTQFDRPAHPVTVTATNGAMRCRRTFSVPVAWRTGPTLYVGRGMASTHGARGFEHISDAYKLFQKADVGSAMAGATILIAASSDQNYYATASGTETLDTNANLRFGWHGPVILRAASQTGARPRMGGPVGSASGGGDISGRGFIYASSGDMIVDGLEVSFVNGGGSPTTDLSHGLSCIRKDGDTWGDFYVLNSNIHDGNNDIETGNGPYWTVVKNTILANFGTQHISSGATHGLYSGACTNVVFEKNIVFHGTNGHGVKTRSKNGTISGNIIIDGERGSLSNCIDICEQGNFVVTNNILQKGPNAQNPYLIQYGEEIYPDVNGNLYRTNNLVISGNTFLNMCPDGNHYGPTIGVSIAGAHSALDGSGVVATLTGNKYYQTTPNQQHFNISPHGFSRDPSITETGAISLTSLPAISLADPTDYTPAARPSWLNGVADNTDTFNYFNYVQIDSGQDAPITIPSSATAGFVLAKCVGYGAPIYYNDSPTSPLIDPFARGAKWSIVQDPQWDGSVPWAPASRYSISPTSGQIVLEDGTKPVSGKTDYIKVRVLSLDNTVRCDNRLSITGA